MKILTIIWGIFCIAMGVTAFTAVMFYSYYPDWAAFPLGLSCGAMLRLGITALIMARD